MSVVGSGERWLLMDCSSKFMQFSGESSGREEADAA